ncbi:MULTISPECIES: glycosyltransferase family A protein [unclassified Cyanobium]|uniref:glycosyltransferase family 2 protein n=1 Tax=unclassified Cyanobium TaxID=2627006 RepID=UPI0020CC8450|nr:MULTISPECIES: glycosyltransferase family A protein [unclassified Cyanobium]MCP9834425.1 glycosyltransferase family 2 protein [Cyanobium sp. La Preciosa 7G6]MCP9937203.1 glycosyltransferase family 2 protein [Cyanobium sp. Aljojuca 7A6]
MADPIVTVLLPVYNCERYLADAIESILSQSYSDFEFIIIDDGSTDRSSEVIAGFGDQRIKVFQHENRGLAATLNRGIELATGKYIARQDQDDLSYPERLAHQVEFMEAHHDCVLLGTWAQIMEIDRVVNRFHHHPPEDAELRYLMLFNNPFVHSSVMLRRSALAQVGGYSTDPDRQPPEDFELWSRLARVGGIANLGEVLLAYREIPGSMSRVGPSPFRHRLITICSENLAVSSGLSADDPDIRTIAALTHGGAEEVSARPDFSRIQSILLAAIQPSATEPLAESLRQDALARVQAMKGAWMVRSSPAYELLQTAGPFRNLAKRIWRLAQRFRGPR